MSEKTILIRCDYTELIQPEELENFQGSLKSQKPQERRKLKDEIKLLGWTAPMYLWFDETTNQKTHKILDGHQRLTAATELLEEGWTIMDKDGNSGIPVIYIVAETERQAADILLGYNAAFSKITSDGLAEFAAKFDFDLEKLQKSKPLIGVNFNEAIKKMATIDLDVMAEDLEPEYEIVQNFQESYNSVIIFCTNEMDFASLKEMLKLPTMKSYKNSNIGTTRVIDFQRFKNAIEMVENHITGDEKEDYLPISPN